MPDEADLMERYCAGEQDAFSELYQQLAPGLLRFLQRLTRDRARAEDLLQVTFLKLHQNRSAYVRGASPRPWLYAIANRAFIDEYRKAQTSKKYAQTVAGDEQRAHITGIPETEAPDMGLDPARAQEAVAALAQLPAAQRRAVELTKLDGLSTEEAAQVMGTSRGAVKQRVHRGYQKLRAVLARDARDKR